MNYELIKISEMSDSLRQTWLEWIRADLNFMSPYFHPDFAWNMAVVRDDVRLILFKEKEVVVGILPIHQLEGNVAAPIGDKMSDYHGVISGKPLEFDLQQMLKATSLKAFYFDHLLASQSSFEPYSWEQSFSPYMLDLSQGSLLMKKNASRGNPSMNLLRNERKCSVKWSESRVVQFSDDEAVMERLLELKSEQYQRTKQLDLTRVKWMTDAMRQLWKFRTDDFSGMLSALYVDDKLLAMHFGMKTRDVLHWWFPTYDTSVHRYSAGLLLLLHLARSRNLV
ncbi:MAG: GNAT family N-acetyltransferase [Planctomycetaceae bacterium]